MLGYSRFGIFHVDEKISLDSWIKFADNRKPSLVYRVGAEIPRVETMRPNFDAAQRRRIIVLMPMGANRIQT